MKRELWQLIIIHLKELIREPGVIFWGIGFPVLMAWGLGIAFSSSPATRTDVAVISYSDESKLGEFIDVYAQQEWTADSLLSFNFSVNDKVFGNNTFRFIPLSRPEAETGMKRGRYQLMLESTKDSILYHIDPANPDARLIQLQLSGLFDDNNKEKTLTRAGIIPLDMQGTRYIDFLVPGLIAMTVMMACMWGISYTIIERRKGNMLRRMVATPMRKSSLLVAHMSARLVMNFAEALILVIFARFYFDMKIQGSWLALFLVFLAGNVAFTGIALLFSSRTSKTEIGNALINVATMPMVILGGVFFSYQNFPEWTLPFIEKLPLTMMADSFRSIINEGAGLADVLENIFILGIGGVLTFAAGIKIFKWY